MEIRSLETEEQLADAISASGERPVLLFKHSTTCPISFNAHRELRRYLEKESEPPDVRMIVVQTARAISDKAAQQLGVRHESPQAILLRDGKAIWNASHFKITSKALETALAGA